MLTKILASVSAAALLAGAAHAVDLNNIEAAAGDEPYPLASALDYAGGVSGNVRVTVGPSAGSFPTGNVLVFVTLTGATFNAALTGPEFAGPAGVTSVISNGGANNGSVVTFLVSGADNCDAPNGNNVVDAVECSITLPVDLTGDDVTMAVGFETDAGADVDNSNRNTRVTATLVEIAPAFKVAIVANTGATVADLNALNGPFTDFTGLSDNLLGTVAVTANAINYGAGLRTVNTALGGAPVNGTDVGAVDLLLTGNMDAFDQPAGDVLFAATSFDTTDATTDEATYDAAALFAATNISVVADGVTAIPRSDYELSVVVTPSLASALTAGTSATGDLQSIDRNGTQITFPWVQSATQGAASGASSVFRIGNLDNADAGAVFVEVKNSSTALPSSITEIAASIGANGEFVINSSQLEAAVGNFGRGDLEFTIEADPDTLTARQFVVRNGVIQQVIGGNVFQDLN